MSEPTVYLGDDGPTITEGVRARLRAFMGPCPNCGKTQRTYREAGKELDINGSVLHRFLKGGGVDSGTLDQLDARLSDDGPDWVPSDLGQSDDPGRASERTDR